MHAQSVANASQINNITEIHTCDRRSHRSAAHRQTGFVKLDAFAITEHRQTPLDVELFHDRGEACLDFVGIEPALVEIRQLL